MNTIMYMNRPASWWHDNWREGTPLGNGLHGALVYGNAARERIILTHARLWRGARQMDVPDVSDVLPKMRELIFSGNVPQADRMLVDALRQRGYAPQGAFPYPGADLHVTLPAVHGFSRYRRSLDLSTAESGVTYVDGVERINRRSFVSRTDDVVVVECHKDSQISITVHTSDIPDQAAFLPTNPYTRTEPGWIYFKALIDGVEHGAVARIVTHEKKLILVKLYTDGSSETKWDELRTELEKLEADYDVLLARHVIAHQRLFNACQFSLHDDVFSTSATNEELLDAAYDTGLPNALTERMWAFGRYLLVCATRTGGLPCNLTGLWSGEYRAFWAFNMANINLEMTYWQAPSAGLAELMLPVFDYYDAAMEDMRENARRIYGCRGIFLPAVTMPGGMKHLTLAPHITNWTAGAGWIAQHYFDYYRYTGDFDFLKNRALPFMKEAALFYLDFVIWQNGKWHVCPSVSPENHTRYYKMAGKDFSDPHSLNDVGDGTQSAIDAAMDIAIIKELFTHLLLIDKTTGLISSDDRATYEKMLTGAIDYQTNEFGAPREWLREHFPDNDLHRHQSHLYPMFPGLELARKDARTTEIYHQGALRRMTVGLSHQTSWSLVQNANTMARVRDGESALESLALIARSCLMRNLFTTHNDWRGSGIGLDMPWAPFQIDANTGWPSAVQEMLLFSDIDRIDLLPALPKAWVKGRIGTLNTRCGVNVDMNWDQETNTCAVTLQSTRGGIFTLYLPDGTCREMQLSAGDVRAFDFPIRSSSDNAACCE